MTIQFTEYFSVYPQMPFSTEDPTLTALASREELETYAQDHPDVYVIRSYFSILHDAEMLNGAPISDFLNGGMPIPETEYAIPPQTDAEWDEEYKHWPWEC